MGRRHHIPYNPQFGWQILHRKKAIQLLQKEKDRLKGKSRNQNQENLQDRGKGQWLAYIQWLMQTPFGGHQEESR